MLVAILLAAILGGVLAWISSIVPAMSGPVGYITLAVISTAVGILQTRREVAAKKASEEEAIRSQERKYRAEREQVEEELKLVRSENEALKKTKEKAEALATKHMALVEENNKLHFCLHQAKVEVDAYKNFQVMLVGFFTNPNRWLAEEKERLAKEAEEDEQAEALRREVEEQEAGLTDAASGSLLGKALLGGFDRD